jgi:hypothetical protein
MKRRNFVTGMAAGSLLAFVGNRTAHGASDEKVHMVDYLFVQNAR